MSLDISIFPSGVGTEAISMLEELGVRLVFYIEENLYIYNMY